MFDGDIIGTYDQQYDIGLVLQSSQTWGICPQYTGIL